ncbi:MAG: nucleoside triphosphate pyrophosphohydrolase [Oscillospiraceae bacterium]|nr:nucleoside triphosphate pyrophosphohydrolase [Oscillospiraceae bacterium]
MTDISDREEFLAKERYGTADLLRIVSILRAPGGCPWDAEQTHVSIRKNFIEETYEAIEAINRQDDGLLCEELGDVLLQLALHTQMAQERGAFAWEQVTDGICRKLIERHPHVFGSVEVDSVGQVLRNWDEIKRRSKGQNTVASAMEHVPRELPALMRAGKIRQKAAAKVGLDHKDIFAALEALEDEVRELRKAADRGDQAYCSDVLGDVLFAAVDASRFLKGGDAEELLTQATDRFQRRFARMEASAKAHGIDFAQVAGDMLGRLWEEAKALEQE